MKLLTKIDYLAFLQAVAKCHGEVWLVTAEGDRLNLKSSLSQFVFVAAVSGKVQFADAILEVEEQEDAALLHPFIVKEG